MSQDKTTLIEEVPTYSTTDYSKFKVLQGSREVNKQHVSYLQKKIQAKNLNKDFPIIVNEKMEVVDGWHRITALKELGFPVYYQVKAHLNSDDMTQINTGMRNWTWRNFAQSFAERNNENYKQFLQLFEDFSNKRFQVALTYCGSKDEHIAAGSSVDSGSISRTFREGDFKMKDYKLTQQLLRQLDEIVEASEVNTRELAIALYQYMRTPNYNHEKMVDHVRKFGSTLTTCYAVSDYIYELEKIYNVHR
jgi:hypothetical protein